jgi:uncharacterized protein YunC (DUF1805 family)
MVTLKSIVVDGVAATAVTVELPRTTLIAVATDQGYIMCGALDVGLLNTRLAERGIVAGRALGVRTVADLLAAPLSDVTDAARALGICAGTTGREAIRLMGATELG